MKYFFTVVRCVTVKCYSLYLYSDFYYCRIRVQSILNFTIQHPTPPPGQPREHLNFLKGQVHDIMHVWVWQYLIVFKPIGSELDAFREIYAGVFLDVWFYFYICPHNSYSLLFLRYVLQPVRIRFTTRSCSETNIYLHVFLWGLLLTHANKAVTDWQTKINM